LQPFAENLARTTVNLTISQGFTHFKRIANISEDKCFKDLRTTFISKMHGEYYDFYLTTTISDHSSPKVVDKRYLAQIEMAKRMTNFRVFGEPLEQ